jgi:hypothetical protein
MSEVYTTAFGDFFEVKAIPGNGRLRIEGRTALRIRPVITLEHDRHGDQADE